MRNFGFTGGTSGSDLRGQQRQIHSSYAPRNTGRNPDIYVDTVRNLFHYDAATGILTWRMSINRNAPAGSVAGTRNKRAGYISVRVYGNVYQAHRIVWLYVFGRWPDQLIDHIDGDPSNNSISNLREASPTENVQNRAALGYTFVAKSGTFNARIGVNRRLIHLGSFKTADEARDAYLAATEKYFGEFSCSLSRGIRRA